MFRDATFVLERRRGLRRLHIGLDWYTGTRDRSTTPYPPTLALSLSSPCSPLFPPVLVSLAMVLSLRLAGLISTSVQAILFGAAVVMYMLTIWILLQKGRHRNINWKMISAACALLVLATAEMIVNIVRITEGFVSVGPGLPGGPEEYFQNVAETTFVIKSMAWWYVYSFPVLFLLPLLPLHPIFFPRHLFWAHRAYIPHNEVPRLCHRDHAAPHSVPIIYRTYIVWQSIVPVLVPIFGWFGLLSAVIGTNVALVQAGSGHQSDVFFVNTGRWITANYAATLATNLSASCLLAYRIWDLNRSVASIRLQGQLSPVVRAVIESGLIYSMTITSALIAFVLKTPGVYVILDLISPIILITFCMIIVRIGMAHHTTLNSTSMMRTSGGPMEYDLNSRRATLNAGSRHTTRELYDMKPLAVEVTQFRAVETDLGTESVYSDRSTRRAQRQRERERERHGRPGTADTAELDMRDAAAGEKSFVSSGGY
ncbi:hypothetical protein D9619_011119 [Psilocybe cf. subviscida]|uniref:Transmembrane protein n=1 Tax=Psilocybe cf. subviscida TaxID=2480587 RepID=A0A8H5BKG0_9AGAR|nr:hypothetical protein D9619_011119 [Psilocybe cf. subviscida]